MSTTFLRLDILVKPDGLTPEEEAERVSEHMMGCEGVIDVLVRRCGPNDQFVRVGPPVRPPLPDGKQLLIEA